MDKLGLSIIKSHRLQKRIQNPIKHIRWSVLRKKAVNYFRKAFHLSILRSNKLSG